MGEIHMCVYTYIYIYSTDEKYMRMYTVSLGVMLRNRKSS